ncbi:MAG TPA: diheme cytochrome c-553 [Ignavibacteriales bacterium]|nr:diheme cytochrome c-553 [Ignavibacteriales bacterium]
MRSAKILVILLGGFFLTLSQISCSVEKENKQMTQQELVARGKYLVTTGGCGDCHTPKIYTANGPIQDTTRRGSGFQAGEKLPALDVKYVSPGNWVTTESNFSAWVGPWGISYAANITPDNATGIGTLTEEMFIKTLRDGKWMGVGRPLLPPMPWQTIGQMTDQDLKAIYAYLKTIKPIHNEVPPPTPPDKMQEMLTGK